MRAPSPMWSSPSAMEMDFLAAVNMRCPVRRVKRGVAPRTALVRWSPRCPRTPPSYTAEPGEDSWMKTISRADPKYALDSGHEPVARVGLGESFVVETHDCRTGTITRSDQVPDLLDTRCVNPATGPIEIEGVRAGDTICVEIEELHVDSRLGLMVTRPGVTGLDITDGPELRIVSCDDSYADVGAFRVPVKPMIGLLGVAPAGEPVSTFRGAEH